MVGYMHRCHSDSRKGCRAAEMTGMMLSCCRQRRPVSCNLGLEGCGVLMWGWGRAGYEWELQAQSGSNSNELTHTHIHTQHEVGSIPTDSESSWANQIINLQGLNYIASVHTYCHIRDTATGTHTPSFSGCLSHTQTHTSAHRHTHTHQGHRSSQHQTTELELWTGREGFVHDMNKISGPEKLKVHSFFDATGDPSFLAPMSIFPCI